ncbi:MAG: hypothetical protein HGB10_01375 [Coriobacteriia bacterium]|nr:hypothetical protein [Coriobacteriia bacterium]
MCGTKNASTESEPRSFLLAIADEIVEMAYGSASEPSRDSATDLRCRRAPTCPGYSTMCHQDSAEE